MLTYENASIGDYTSNHNTSWALVRSNSNASIGDYTSNHNKVGYFVICLSNASIGDYTSNHNPRICKRLRNKTIIYLKFARKWRCKYLIAAKLLKKIQLYGLRRFLFLDSSPNVDDIAILSVGNRKDTHLPMIWNRQAYTLEMNLCAFKRGTETHIDTELKHHKPILL